MLTYREATYEEIYPLWKKLWSQHEFGETSSMLYLGGYDSEIPQKYRSTFLAAVDENRIVGTFSLHQSSEEHWRLRGLFIESECRNQGIAFKLVELATNKAKENGAKLIWATPRASSLDIFINLGFEQVTDFLTDGFTYGPNCYVAIKNL